MNLASRRHEKPSKECFSPLRKAITDDSLLS